MDKKEINDWMTAGKIAAESLNFASTLVKEYALLIDINNKIEEFIIKKGAKLAFPVNLSLNNIAAHYIAFPEDKTQLKSADILKVDIGVEYNGCIGDTARSFEINTATNKKLIQASESARDNAIKIIKAGIELWEIGKIIEDTIKSYGFLPVKNLSGHGLAKFTVHADPTIPNYNDGDKTKLKEGQIIAIEPFATTGSGFIKEGKPSTIYRLSEFKPVRDLTSRKILELVLKEYKTLPFSKLAIVKKFPSLLTTLALNSLEKQGIICQYAQLPEESPNSLVSQSEHTVLVEKNSCRILTKAD